MALQVFQSLWGMIGLPRNAPAWSPTEQLDAIVDAGFDGASISFDNPTAAADIARQAADRGLRIEVVCYPVTPGEFDDLLVVLDQPRSPASRTSTRSHSCAPRTWTSQPKPSSSGTPPPTRPGCRC